MGGVGDFVQARLDGGTGNLVGPTSIVPYGTDGHRQVRVLGPAERLSVVQSLKSGVFIHMFLHQISELVEELATLKTRGIVAPDGVEGLLGGLNSCIDVLGCSR